MPVIEDSQPKKRRARWWVLVLVLAVAVFPFLGLFAWSNYQPVAIPLPGGSLGLGHGGEEFSGSQTWSSGEWGWLLILKLPGGAGTGSYVAQWSPNAPPSP